jgi:7tm Odorant receptor
MTSGDLLFKELLIVSERILSPLGIWPTASNSWISLFNVVTRIMYSILVLIKNYYNPEKESIENAFTLGNGGLITVMYFIVLLMKKEKCIKFFNSIKSERKLQYSDEEKRIQHAVGREYQKISTAFMYMLPIAIFIKFIQPLMEYLYIKLFKLERSFELPPSMGIPVEIVGEYPTYILESMIRAQMLITLMGVCSVYILSTLFICMQFQCLAINLKSVNDESKLVGLIKEHVEILKLVI